ncbi:uncharacterized protein LOC123534256 [Mercenaria mercenaria]|uniref:uncharacterized protein LOC123534256 n=1 Tax=Mercenaria mercenaria TaxID=6596 RepID=UPI00234E5354|nr:uncharacterized protein LOC123534256 [Mercenaria mercenaria]
MVTLREIIVVALLVCYSVNVCFGYHSCKELKQHNTNLQSGEYSMYNGKGQAYKAFCEFHGTYGYMFISKNAGVEIKLDLINPDTHEVLVRHVRSNGKQYVTKMRQLSSKTSVPLSIQYNKYVNYASPVNFNTMGPFLYLGFLPRSIANQKSIQGYNANGKDFTFTNCNKNPNSYLAFFFNPSNGNPTNYHLRCCYTKLMQDWINEGKTASSDLSQSYFFQFEMHMGGCGGYAINGYNKLSNIGGAALGMRFSL